MKTFLCKNIFFIAFFCLTGCGNEDLPQYTKLDRLRILAITTPTPEIQNPAGGVVNVNITPYLSDVSGSGNLTLTIQSCLDPGTSLGVAPTCEGGTFASTPQTVSVTAPAGQADGTFGSPERTGAPSTGAITVGLNVPAGLLSAYSASAQNNGVPYLITVTVNSSSGSIRAFRRILFSTKTVNSNPVLADLFSQGASLTVRPTSDVDLSFTAAGSPETYNILGTDGVIRSETEIFETTWFISDGEILNPRTKVGETTKWSAGSAPQGRKTVVSGVLRDGRGGVSVMIRTLN
ncbi:MAG: hypothetical protein ACK5P5_11175 [Pseudobdellovibrionaceae bacterium]